MEERESEREITTNKLKTQEKIIGDLLHYFHSNCISANYKVFLKSVLIL